MTRSGLPPRADDQSEVLILGTFPGKESLDSEEYYRNPTNQFWSIIFHVIDKDDPGGYEKRIESLLESHIALWDILKECERDGSADSAIKLNSQKPNDICLFVESKPSIKMICFNGTRPWKLFKKLLDGTCVEVLIDICETVPSSSAANTHNSLEDKKRKWKTAIESALGRNR